jgi:hypothetical protein
MPMSVVAFGGLLFKYDILLSVSTVMCKSSPCYDYTAFSRDLVWCQSSAKLKLIMEDYPGLSDGVFSSINFEFHFSELICFYYIFLLISFSSSGDLTILDVSDWTCGLGTSWLMTPTTTWKVQGTWKTFLCNDRAMSNIYEWSTIF